MVEIDAFVESLSCEQLCALYDYLIENERNPGHGSTYLLGAVADRRQTLMDISEGLLGTVPGSPEA